jgi:hypothetical protein
MKKPAQGGLFDTPNDVNASVYESFAPVINL